MYWTVIDPKGRTYVFNVAAIKAVGMEENWIAVYYLAGEMVRFEYATPEEAEKVLQSFQDLVGA